MYDYKFRQKNPSFKDKDTDYTRRRIFLLAAGLALAAGLLYGIISVGLTRDNGSKVPETDSDTIPLELPPYAEPKENT